MSRRSDANNRRRPSNYPAAAFISGIESSGFVDLPAKVFDSVSTAVNGSSAGPLLRGSHIGHALHPLLTDIPLGCWLSAGLLDLIGGKASRGARQRLVGAEVLTALPTGLSGLAEWKGLVDRSTRRVAVVHATGNLAVVSLYAMSWTKRKTGHHRAGTAWGLVGGILAIFTGYLGGHLSFGRGVGHGERWPSTPGSDGTVAGAEEN